MINKRFLNKWILLNFFGLFTIALSLSAQAENLQPLDRVALIVNTNVILESEIDKEVAKVKDRLIKMRVAQPPAQELRTQVINQMIMQSAALDISDKMGIKISDEEFLYALENIAKSQGLSIAQLKNQITSSGESFESYREDLIKQIKISRVQQYQIASRIQITDSQINDFLRTNEGAKLDDREFKLAHILLPLPESPTAAELAQANAKMADIKSQLEKGADFKSLAISSSSSSTALSGGDLGWLKILEMPSLFAQKVGDMQIGEVIAPLRSASGLHLIKLLDKRNAKKQIYKQYHFKRIVLVPNKVRNSTATKKLADSILAQLKQGKNFGELAKKYSDDMISKQAGGELGWIMPESIDPQLAPRLKSIPVNSYSEVLSSRLGWEIWQNLGTKNVDLSEEALKAEVRELLFRRKFAEEAEVWTNSLRQSLYIEYKE